MSKTSDIVERKIAWPQNIRSIKLYCRSKLSGLDYIELGPKSLDSLEYIGDGKYRRYYETYNYHNGDPYTDSEILYETENHLFFWEYAHKASSLYEDYLYNLKQAKKKAKKLGAEFVKMTDDCIHG